MVQQHRQRTLESQVRKKPHFRTEGNCNNQLVSSHVIMPTTLQILKEPERNEKHRCSSRDPKRGLLYILDSLEQLSRKKLCYLEGKVPLLLPASELKHLPAGQPHIPHLPFLPPAGFECLLNSKGFSPRFLQHRGRNPRCQGRLLPSSSPGLSQSWCPAGRSRWWLPAGREKGAGRSLQSWHGHIFLSHAQQDGRVAVGTTASSVFTFSPTTPPGRRNKSDCENQPI